ncbi:3TM-type holin [Niveispirillum sp. KHB5.9]|uniref:3TM-type holin n=1 Tax=Niveispirillum sp. KHB5.9 TaxID=3400269 RepID=UPI003A86FA0A
MLTKLLQTVIGGGVQAVASAITPFTGDKVQDEQGRHAEMLARFQQFGAEFADRQARTWWDSFIDGLNRLPRPAMALGVIGIFVWASADPVGFAAAAQAWALIPEEMWIVLGAVITFFFGDRTLLASRRSRGPTMEQVQAVLDTQRKIAAMRPVAPVDPDRYAREMADRDTPLSDDVIREWNRRHGANGAG